MSLVLAGAPPAPPADHLQLARQIREVADLAVHGDLLAVLHRSARAAVSARSTRDVGPPVLDALTDLLGAGGVASLAAIEVLGSLPGRIADDELVGLLEDADPLVRRHATWRLRDRPIQRRAVPALVQRLLIGGIDTMHAHRTLQRWSLVQPATVIRGAATALAVTDDPTERARLVDLIGVVPDRGTDGLLVDLALDLDESPAPRIAAIGALADRHSSLIEDALGWLAQSDDDVGTHAALALQPMQSTRRGGPRGGLRIAQLVLAGGLDGQLSLGGRGETGGVASLLVSLGGALGRRADVEHVVTIGRGSIHDAVVGPIADRSDPSSFGTIAIGDPARPAPTPADAWEHVPTIERGLRRAIGLAGEIDVLHLRMADAGTLAGAEVAASLGLPICFSLAPDPHNVIQSLQSRGELDATSFATLETDQHLWFRARLVERLGRDANRLALFPRARQFEFVDDLELGTDAANARSAEIAEGIDLAAIRQAERELAVEGRVPSVLDELSQRIPEHRRHLPLLVSVGRLHPVKGMERVARAWAADARLRSGCNLVIVGGALDSPTASERAVLDAIDEAVDGHDAADGLVTFGGRPHADIARLLVAAVEGHGGGWAPGGVYVDGALKEEFGLAVLEAMAAGLVVVAPSTGGPSTYVDDDDTGVLVDPGADLGAAIRRGFELRNRPRRRERARSMIEARYSIETMADQLVALYEPVAA